MGKKSLHLLLVAFVACTTIARAQLYNYTNNLSGVPASVAANATASSLGLVNGAAVTTGCPDGYNAYKFSESTTYGTNRPAIEFSIAPNSGYQLTITDLSVNARRNNKGPVSWRLAYSTDGGVNWITNGSDLTVNSIDCGTNTVLIWDIPDFTATASVKVRIYAYGSLSNLNGKNTVRNVVLSGSVSFADMDGDGYTSDADCNDFNNAINPGVAEICNTIDDNCSGVADEGVQTTFYADADGDTYGDAGVSILACSAPAGYVSDNTDCNDATVEVNPGLAEICNEFDDNCNGSIDEGVQTTFYADVDGDGFGDAGNSTLACSVPGGYTSDNSDCNDGDASVNPAAAEICNGLDDNCDGNADEGLTFVTYYADADGDAFGNAAVSVTDCSGAPAGFVEDNNDCNDGDAAINPGALEICNGLDDNCEGSTDEGLTFETFYADTDGDGFGDAGTSVFTCSGAPAGYVSNADDCNDGLITYTDADGDGFGFGTPAACGTVSNNDDCDDTNLTYTDADGDGFGFGAPVACGIMNNDDCDDALVTYTDNDGDGFGFGSPVACGSITNSVDCDDAALTYNDADGDGYGTTELTACGVPYNTDCNDASSDINPGVAEVCNALDDDCTGVADDGLTFLDYYTDADGDGYGDAAASAVNSCSAIEGSATNNSDCNDAAGSVNPGVTEICNTIDDNCDGSTDEGVTITSYADNDGDTFGNEGASNTGCSVPSGYVMNNTDCNDASATVYPGAPEICGNGIDEDCDGTADVVAAIIANGSTSICLGNTVTLQATTGGTGLSYQWIKNGNPIAGATNSTYAAALQGNYKCTVSKPACTSTSAVIVVSVNTLPAATITTPDGLDLCGKSNVKLKANIGATLTYQWYKDGVLIPGGIGATYYANLVGNYYVVVTNNVGCSKQSATVTVVKSCRLSEGETHLSLYPNPTDGAFVISLQTDSRISESVKLSLIDLSGREVAVQQVDIVDGVLEADMHIDQPNGLYMVQITGETVHLTQQLMITK